MPELKWRYGDFAMLGLMGFLALGIPAIFWDKRWITQDQRGVRKMTPLTFDLDKVKGGGRKSENWWA